MLVKPLSHSTIEFNTHIERKKTARSASKMYLSAQDIKNLVQECGEASCLLYQYYTSKAGIDGFEYTDAKSAKYFGWKESKAKQLRLKLSKANWFYQVSGKLNNGKKIINTYLGKNVVQEEKGIKSPLPFNLSKIKEDYDITADEITKATSLFDEKVHKTQVDVERLFNDVKSTR